MIEEVKTKVCTKCGIEKPIENFYIRKERRNGQGRRSMCDECSVKHSQSYQGTERYLSYQKEYEKRESRRRKKKEYNKTAPRIKYIKEYQIEHREKYTQNVRNYRKTVKYKNSLAEYLKRENVRLIRKLRSRIYSALKVQNGKKYKKTIDMVGCSIEFLKQYLESKFQDGMNWNNRSKTGWHIDHIIPCSSFDLTDIEQQKKCFHYTNLQPLWAKDNLSKGAKLVA